MKKINLLRISKKYFFIFLLIVFFLWIRYEQQIISNNIKDVLTPFKKTQASISDIDLIDTSSWKTYTNTNFKLSFLYPPEWQVREMSQSSDKEGFYTKLIRAQSYKYKGWGNGGPYSTNLPNAPNGIIIDIYNFANPKKLNVKDFIESAEGLNHRKESRPTFEVKIEYNIFVQETYRNNDFDIGDFYISGPIGYITWVSPFMYIKNGGVEKLPLKEHEAYAKLIVTILSTIKFTN